MTEQSTQAADAFTILITGATDGLGRLVAEGLARQGGSLLLHGRNPEKGAAVLESLRRSAGHDRLRYYNADLASLAEVRRLAEEISAAHPRLDLLINNAGIGAGPRGSQRRETSADGFELRLAVNYLAPFLLTRALLPLLRRTAEEHGGARIVNVASAGQQTIDFADPLLELEYSGMRAYCQSKLALVMFTFDLAKELEGSDVTANVLHPATLMDTKMVHEWFGYTRSTVDEGARAVEHLALSPALHGVSGEYFDGLRPAAADPQAYDAEARRQLRNLSERWTGVAAG